MNKQYIGDGIYADYDGYAFILTTENGIERTNIIVIEPIELKALAQYVRRILEEKSAEIKES